MANNFEFDAFARMIQDLRKKKGLSQHDLAKKAKLARTTIGRMECGTFKTLSLHNLENIAQVLDLDLKTLLVRSQTDGSFHHRTRLNQFEFVLDHPESGFRILSLIPKKEEFFLGKMEIKPQKTIPSDKLPHPAQICLYLLEGKVVVHSAGEFVLKPGDCLAFSGAMDYEFYNPDPMKTVSFLFLTLPSFLH